MDVLLFLSAVLFTAVLLWGNAFSALAEETGTLLKYKVGMLPRGEYGLADYREAVESILQNKLQYRFSLVSLNSLRENLLGTRIVVTTDTTVVKADSGNLLGDLRSEYDEETVASRLAPIEALERLAEQNGAGFLCCLVPTKPVYETATPNVINANGVNYDLILAETVKRGIPYLDFRSLFEEQGLSVGELFFYTDHHWRPAAGLLAARTICGELSERYGFVYPEKDLDPAQFRVQTYKDHFLGSYGKKTGLLFTQYGADDFDLITPLFPTDFQAEVAGQPPRRGEFEDSLLDSVYLRKDYYEANTYVVYSGGDFRLQRIDNLLHPDGAKILIVRDSAGCVVTPFLALAAGELHVVDDREGSYPAGAPIDLESYISELRPDYVVYLKFTY
ncbi:MAG: hypothetical protein K6F56_05370 [Oscillospiraceae bacterium]|nr:hypothetical protein [Oscillospiraceae bacterium]